MSQPQLRVESIGFICEHLQVIGGATAIAYLGKSRRILCSIGGAGTSSGLHPIIALVRKGIPWPAVLLFVFAACELIYHFGPNLRERRRWQWFSPGSIFGALVWIATSFGLRLYLHFFGSYNAAYGLLGAVMILMLWLYVGGLAYLIGAEINAEIARAGGPTGSRQMQLQK